MSTLLFSKANTGKHYIKLQARTYSPTRLHVQGLGASQNRDYGVAVTVAVPESLATFFNNQVHDQLSLAGSGETYVAFQARFRTETDDTVHCQLIGSDGDTLNRDYGASFDIVGDPVLTEFVANQLEFLEQMEWEEEEEEDEEIDVGEAHAVLLN